jgi:hypothetical protein
MSTFDEIFVGRVTLCLEKEVALVLFEMLSDAEDESAMPIRDVAERYAIWMLVGRFESALAEPFRPDYGDIVEEAKKRVALGRGSTMPWPPEIQEADDKINQARNALLADVENGQPYDAERRHTLLVNLKRGQDEFFAMVAQLHA